MLQMIAKTDLKYANRVIRAGDEFEASERDAKILEAIGKAQTKRKRSYRRRDMSAQ